ncbi:MAG: exodeoxyribonuclease III [Acidimicrobiales bacterium]
MRIATWNVNSIRTRHGRRDEVASGQRCRHPATARDEVSRRADVAVDDYANLGYETAHTGVDHWNGVAILSRVGLDDVRRGFPGDNRPPFDEARVMSALCGGIRVWSVYVPNGRELDDPHYLFKLVWLERLRSSIDPREPNVVAGDFNVAPTDADIYDPRRWKKRTHASKPERGAIVALTDLGLRDVMREHLPGPGVFTWWGYRPGQFELNRGLRIDLALCSPSVADRVRTVRIDTEERAGERPSDHAPVVLELTN